jgi:hypothetical protein
MQPRGRMGTGDSVSGQLYTAKNVLVNPGRGYTITAENGAQVGDMTQRGHAARSGAPKDTRRL